MFCFQTFITSIYTFCCIENLFSIKLFERLRYFLFPQRFERVIPLILLLFCLHSRKSETKKIFLVLILIIFYALVIQNIGIIRQYLGSRLDKIIYDTSKLYFDYKRRGKLVSKYLYLKNLVYMSMRIVLEESNQDASISCILLYQGQKFCFDFVTQH